MKVIVACEESQTVCKAFRELGHEAYSCDIQEPSGGHPEWHILGDAVEALKGGVVKTMDLQLHEVGRWDLAICHPPCTYLTVSGNAWFNTDKYGKKAEERWKNRVYGAVFFMMMFLANADRIAVENPVCIMSSCFRKPDQVIQPYEYGHNARKTTCLWLVNLPKLIPTNIVDPGEIVGNGFSKGASLDAARDENGKIIPWNDPRTAKIRSKTFQGIANAMAEQWGSLKPISSKSGRWETDSYEPDYFGHVKCYKCSVCGYENWVEPYKYCPECGTLMRGAER